MDSKERMALDEKLAEIILLNTDKNGKVSKDTLDVLKENNITLSQVFDSFIYYLSLRVGPERMRENILTQPNYHRFLECLKEKIEPCVYKSFITKLKLTQEDLYETK